MHEQHFAAAIRPDLQVVLRLPMRPYSIGHEILLIRQGNPLVTMGPESFKELPEDRQRSALRRAALVCYRSWTQNQKRDRWLWLWGWFIRNFDLETEVENFQAYRTDGIRDFKTVKMPRIRGAENVPYHYFGSPEMARLILFLLDRRLPEFHGVPTVYDFPVSLARMLYLSSLEETGAVWVQNWHDRQAEQAREEFEERHPENTLAVGNEAVRKLAMEWNESNPDCKVPVPDPES